MGFRFRFKEVEIEAAFGSRRHRRTPRHAYAYCGLAFGVVGVGLRFKLEGVKGKAGRRGHVSVGLEGGHP